MITASLIARSLGAACLLAGALTACAPPPQANPARQAELAACRDRADTVFQKQNRYLLSERGNLSAPQSGVDPDPDRSMGAQALAGQYGRDQQVAECARGSDAVPVPESLPAAGDTSEVPPTQ